MWFIAQWIDARLISAMYPGGQGNMLIRELTHLASGSVPQGYKRMILNIPLLTLYRLPFIWTAMMSWIGLRIGGQIDQMMTTTSSAANSSASTSTSVATRGKVK